MNNFKLSQEAVGDLQDIWVFIAKDNPVAADRVEAEIYEACDLLVKNPRLGHRRPDLTSEPVLFWPVRSHYLVVYQKASQLLMIVRVLHASRDAVAQFE